MYVTDEGTGNGSDASTNAGLQKWILGSDGINWQERRRKDEATLNAKLDGAKPFLQ